MGDALELLLHAGVEVIRVGCESCPGRTAALWMLGFLCIFAAITACVLGGWMLPILGVSAAILAGCWGWIWFVDND